ncbi:MAG: type III pantothenate kinase [Cytophagales bacterium]|nr:type III pantothenate kinase [Cytophagales bacterium]MCA6386993.1 type III pantothenate kinase [Cytophagales bacterium]MCA6390083.1 type III pantothenate kinase [Cytophagales bacterium]MCA6395756.1 type III pantothenate kinase [Cytophagales bacterium]MCA6399408.1 type III pantothenate kinase [Cytophagales bacterium]
MLNLVIDFGNSRIKTACFEQESLLKKNIFNNAEELQAAFANTVFENILISSVNQTGEEATAKLQTSGKKSVLHHQLPLPIQLLYATPETLGVDRIAAACGALAIFPGKNCLIIDAGTCINFEFVDANANYHGGAISPGIEMRFKAMHTFTARLPLVKWNDQVGLMGNSTESCLQSGVLNGIVGEINGVAEQYASKFPELKIILCGGDAPFFENQLKPTIFAAPDLVLMGLNRILRYNAS